MRVGIMNKSSRAALISTLSILISLSPWISSGAQASPRAAATGVTSTTGSARFIAYATTSPTGVNPTAALVLSNSSSAQYFYIRNTGTISISAFTITLSYSSGPGTVTLFHCDQGVAFSGSSCVSGNGKVSISQSGSVSLVLPSNSWYAFELNPKNSVTPTVSISVSSSQIRSPIISNG
jgi:hypothetical protein